MNKVHYLRPEDQEDVWVKEIEAEEAAIVAKSVKEFEAKLFRDGRIFLGVMASLCAAAALIAFL